MLLFGDTFQLVCVCVCILGYMCVYPHGKHYILFISALVIKTYSFVQNYKGSPPSSLNKSWKSYAHI